MARLVRGSACVITQDDLLHVAIRWVKENGGDGPDFVSKVAVILEVLRYEMREPASLGGSDGELLRISGANDGERECVHGNVSL